VAGTSSARGRTLQRTLSLATLSHLPFANAQAGIPGPSNSGIPMILSPLILTQLRPASPSIVLPTYSIPVTPSYEQAGQGAANILLQQVLQPLTPSIQSDTLIVLIWNVEHQTQFENRLARLTASAGLPFSWVDNPEWLEFCEEFLPNAKSPSRKVLTMRIIPKLANQLQDQSKSEVKGQEVSLQADGWTGENHRHQENGNFLLHLLHPFSFLMLPYVALCCLMLP
jgi:hypothetical protein